MTMEAANYSEIRRRAPRGETRSGGCPRVVTTAAFMVQTLRLYMDRTLDDRMGWLAALAPPQLGAALGAVHADPGRRWTLGELAGTAGMSRTVFARRFREVLGETPLGYVTRWRMILAAERLVSTRASLGEIAQTVGYESENAFNVAFKRVMGAAPRRYAREGAG